jgi:hypothetical protein
MTLDEETILRSEINNNSSPSSIKNATEGIENFAQMELPHTIFLTGRSGAAAAEDSAAPDDTIKENFVEGLDDITQSDPKQVFNDVKKYAMAPVAFMMNLSPEQFTDTKFVDATINYLAGPPIVDTLFDPSAGSYAVAYAESPENANAAVSWGEYLRQFFDIDYLATNTTQTTDANTKYMEDVLNKAKEGDTSYTPPPPDDRPVYRNPELESDRKIIKKYTYKTIVVLISFVTVYSWALFFFTGRDYVVADKDEQCARLKSGGLDEVPVVGYFSLILNNIIIPVFESLNPFYFAKQIVDGIADFFSYLSGDMDKTLNKEIWYFVIFTYTFFSTQYFIGNYRDNMKVIRNFGQNGWIILLYVLCILLYLISFVTDFGPMKRVQIMTGGIFMILYYLIKNIIIIMLIVINPYVALFLIVMIYLGISLFGVFMYPTGGINISKKLKELDEKIEQSYNRDTSTDSTFWVIFRFLCHMLYKNMRIAFFIMWIIYLYYVFNYSKTEQLKYDSLRMNVNTTIGIFLLLFITVLVLYRRIFGSGGAKAKAEAATAT